ncbi:Uma2 family endonuclease [Oscillatoria laete-virens NRMC-F 0139]|nr:Uma2 family endonuclease [Oscillatoria laete-virens]MDL5053726.1 Uma2 family endonuclease [Oscillatoria laete-virens NRMC-F 0139]
MTPLLKRLFTVDEFQRMAEVSILTERDRVELIEGEIIQMAAMGTRHAACVRRLIRLFSDTLSNRVLIDAQNPVELGPFSLPQPDIALLRLRDDLYESGHPQPEDILLIVEVADTPVDSDRNLKIPLYTRTGIVEVWLINLNQNCIEVYHQPTAQGYQEIQICQPNQTLTVQAFPEFSVQCDRTL